MKASGRMAASFMVLIFSLSCGAYAQQDESGGPPPEDEGQMPPMKHQRGERQQPMGMMQGGQMMGMCPMHGMMMKQMTDRSLVATSDGGVVLLCAGKLYKYDKELKLVGEAETAAGIGNMEQMMNQMKEGCPACKGCMGPRKMTPPAGGEGAEGEGEGPQGAEPSAEAQ